NRKITNDRSRIVNRTCPEPCRRKSVAPWRRNDAQQQNESRRHGISGLVLYRSFSLYGARNSCSITLNRAMSGRAWSARRLQAGVGGNVLPHRKKSSVFNSWASLFICRLTADVEDSRSQRLAVGASTDSALPRIVMTMSGYLQCVLRCS